MCRYVTPPWRHRRAARFGPFGCAKGKKRAIQRRRARKMKIPNPPHSGGFGMTIKESGDASIEHRAATAALKDRRYTDTIELPTWTRFFRARRIRTKDENKDGKE